MVRRVPRRLVLRGGSPHSRGDGPAFRVHGPFAVLFSPLAWGWSVVRAVWTGAAHVLPTRVGMVRLEPVNPQLLCCSPHSRGDGPKGFARALAAHQFSPL